VISVLSQDAFPTADLCDSLQVSRSAYYTWKQGRLNVYQQQDEQLQPMVQDVFYQHKRRYGARRIARDLTERGTACSRQKVRKIMEQLSLTAIQPKSFQPRTTNSKHTLGYSPNLLLENFRLDGVNQVWVGDITYIALPSRFAYLAILLDLFSRRIVGWAFAMNMEASLVIAAFRKAIRSRQPPPGLIHHTDRGGQYAAIEYRKLLSRAHMKQSMSRAADCYDNAFMESCFGTIKTELELTSYPSREEAQREIQEYINYYNTLRRHSSIDYLSPTRFEASRCS
jgi:putative transposase